jgi:hypothetical protein
MRLVPLMPLLLLVASLPAMTQSADDHASDRAYIREAESDWAESVASNAVDVLERILSDDFVGVDIDGSHIPRRAPSRTTAQAPRPMFSITSIMLRFASMAMPPWPRAVKAGRKKTERPDVSSGPIPGLSGTASGKLSRPRISCHLLRHRLSDR